MGCNASESFEGSVLILHDPENIDSLAASDPGLPRVSILSFHLLTLVRPIQPGYSTR
jgi:hypothetical protein